VTVHASIAGPPDTRPGAAAPGLGDLLDELTSYIPEAMRVTGTPGANVAVAAGGEVIWEQGFGFADLHSGEPMTPATVTRGGSLSKLYVAVAVLQLVERGVLGLHDDVGKYVDGFRVVNPLGDRPITARDLLTHHSGLVGDTGDGSFEAPEPLGEFMRTALTSDRCHEYYGSSPRWTAKVGERYQYSNLGVGFLGYLVELLNPEGLTFEEYARRHIIEPLGMISTAIPPVVDAAHVPPHVLRHLSTGHGRFGTTYVPSPIFQSGPYPATMLLTTPGDHIRLMAAMLGNGSLAGARILEPESVQLMLTPTVRPVERNRTVFNGLVMWLYGVGEPGSTFGHSGAVPWGWWNDARAYPGHDVAVAVFTNKWDMPKYHNPAPTIVLGLVAEFVRAWLAEGDGARTQGAASWPWKASYAAGVLMAERTCGLSAAGRTLPDEMLDDMVARTVSLGESVCQGWSWDEAGFRAGVADMLANEPRSDEVRAFIADPERLGVPQRELSLLTLGFGRPGPFPAPLEGFADWLV
jgi:CubicO group peptidase (beta-lactamase class C family)